MLVARLAVIRTRQKVSVMQAVAGRMVSSPVKGQGVDRVVAAGEDGTDAR